MKIGIIGNYGATNIGDDAILSSILKACDGNEVTVFSANSDELRTGPKMKSAALFPLGFRSVYKYGFKKSIVELKELDLVILGGGGLFQDSYLYACFLWAWQIFWVSFYKKPLFVYATGVGPLNTWMGKKLTKWAYGKAEVITVRDRYSANILKKIGIKKEVIIAADPVFAYEKPKVGQNEKPTSRQKGLFLISVRPWLKYNSRTIEAFGDFLAELKEERKANFIFICMQEIKENDLQIIKPIMRRVGGDLHLSKNFTDLLDVMETAEFAVGMRYHFMIAAILTHTPIIPVSYAPKTKMLFEETRLENHVINIGDLNADALRRSLKEVSIGYNNGVVYEKQLSAVLSEKALENTGRLGAFIKTFDQVQKR